MQSPFGFYSHRLCENSSIHLSNKKKKAADIGDSDTGSVDSNLGDMWERNPYYNLKFLRYIMTTILPYAPLMNHSLMHHNDMTLVNDTNAPIESSFNVSCLIYTHYTNLSD